MLAISPIDISIIVVCLLLVFIVAAVSSLREKTETDDYFLADKNLPFWAAAGSIFASNIGNEHFVGQAGTAADSGIAVSLYEWTAVYSVLSLDSYSVQYT